MAPKYTRLYLALRVRNYMYVGLCWGLSATGNCSCAPTSTRLPRLQFPKVERSNRFPSLQLLDRSCYPIPCPNLNAQATPLKLDSIVHINKNRLYSFSIVFWNTIIFWCITNCYKTWDIFHYCNHLYSTGLGYVILFRQWFSNLVLASFPLSLSVSRLCLSVCPSLWVHQANSSNAVKQYKTTNQPSSAIHLA